MFMYMYMYANQCIVGSFLIVNIINMQCASVPTLQVVHVHVGSQIRV